MALIQAKAKPYRMAFEQLHRQSSILNETGFNPDAIERQLAHRESNSVRAAYTHLARYIDERRKMMQWWADYLEEMKSTGKVVPLFSKATNQ
jgi:integrase